MGSNICGNCGNFKPKPGEKFVNCTGARHAGLSYGMQVRVDSRACDAFMPFYIDSNPKSEPIQQKDNQESDDRVEAVGLCRLGKNSLVAAVALAVILVSWLLYTCARV